jgi:hypothetical protein
MGDVKKMISVLIAAGLQQEQTSPPSTRAAIFPKWANLKISAKGPKNPQSVSQPFCKGLGGKT